MTNSYHTKFKIGFNIPCKSRRSRLDKNDQQEIEQIQEGTRTQGSGTAQEMLMKCRRSACFDTQTLKNHIMKFYWKKLKLSFIIFQRNGIFVGSRRLCCGINQSALMSPLTSNLDSFSISEISQCFLLTKFHRPGKSPAKSGPKFIAELSPIWDLKTWRYQLFFF